MAKQIIKTEKVNLPVGPYNQGVSTGQLIYTAGQIPLDPAGNLVSGGIKEQTKQVLENVRNVVEAGGSSLENVIKATVFLKDLNDFAGMNEVYGQYFKAETAPARTTIQVSRIPKDSLVEIEVVALKS
jgi:2-iminobutanoate/2-iminopropanoate deaminase